MMRLRVTRYWTLDTVSKHYRYTWPLEVVVDWFGRSVEKCNDTDYVMSISLYPFEIIDNLEQTDALTWRLLGFKEKGEM